MLSKAIQSMALVGDEEAKEKLKDEALSFATVEDWKSRQVAKVAGVGGATGLLGGPWGLALEAADIAYLFAVSGRACYGVGHILGRELDYESDIPLILSVWSGAGETAAFVGIGQVGIKAGGVAAKTFGVSAKIIAGATLAATGKAGGKVAGKIITKAAFKGGAKVSTKIVTKVGGKVGSKAATKLGFKWMPLIGGLVSAGINYWVANGLVEAAIDFYNSEYVVFDDEIASEFS